MFCSRVLLLVLLSFNLNAEQKKIFTPAEAMHFEQVTRKAISDDGKWVVYRLKPDRGDGSVFVKSVNSETEYEIKNGARFQISENSSFVAVLKKPKALEIENAKKDKKPKNSIVLLNTESGKTEELKNILPIFKLSNDGSWLVYKKFTQKKKSGKKKKKQIIGESIRLRHNHSASEFVIDDVTNYLLDSTSSFLFYTVSTPDKSKNGIFYRDLLGPFAKSHRIEQDSGVIYSNLKWNRRKNILAYLCSNLDSNEVASDNVIKIWRKSNSSVSEIVPKDFEQGWFIPSKNYLSWSWDGWRLYFGFKKSDEILPDEKDDKEKKISEEEFYSFDKILEDTELFLWHSDDPKIIPNQKIEWEYKKNKSYLGVYHQESNEVARLGDENLEVERAENPYYAIAKDKSAHHKRITWDGWYYDLYYVNLHSGKKTLIEKEVYSSAYLSPKGQFIVYFHKDDWWVYEIANQTKRNVTTVIDVNFHNELNDRPSPSQPYGFGGFTSDGKSFAIYDRYDIWMANTGNAGMQNITDVVGRQNKQNFRIKQIEPKQKYLDIDEFLYLTAFSEIDKSQILYSMSPRAVMSRLGSGARFKFIAKAKNNDAILYSKESYDIYPDLYISNQKLDTSIRITNIFPQIEDYVWGKTEMINYQNSRGDNLQGYLIKPEDYDSTKKYPIFVYFYERFSDRRHEFIIPKINHRPIYPWYVGQGYCMFFPDIKFYQGRPGDSGLDAVKSGCEKLIEMGIADKDKIALHGHSWSGYMSAYFVTQTDFFSAVVTGAPVSNMTSAYSGIRLGSGLARQFQYEKTQSRIGGTMIDSLDAYIENSPVFYADKMNTPMLIMFGDKDDAVPYEQGVELYLACRRFEKNCIMLQYEGEPHHLKKYANSLDYILRMKEFFDHYTLGKPAATWIENPIPYKGKYNTGREKAKE